MFFESLKSRLGRKFSVLFLVAALIPLVVVSLIVYQYTASYVLEQREKVLNKEAKILSIVLVERLAFLKTLILQQGVDQLARPDFQRYFSSITTTLPSVDAASTPIPLSLQLSVVDKANVTLTHTAEENGVVSHFHVNPDYLWGDLSVLSDEYSYCVFSGEHQPIFCTGELESQKMKFQKLLAAGENWQRWSNQSSNIRQELLIKAREIFMMGNFSGGSWVVFTSSSMEDVLAPIRFFKSLFVALFGLTLVLIVIVSNRQISRLLTPLKSLSKGAKAIADRRFDEVIKVDSNDELEDVATAFNQMSNRISQHFNLLTSLSEVDRLILTGQSLKEIAKSTWLQMRTILKGEFLCIGTLDNKASITLELLSGPMANASPDGSTYRLLASDQAFQKLGSRKNAMTRDELKGVDNAIASILLNEDFSSIYIVPIIVDQCWLGFVALGYGEMQPASDDCLSHLNDFVDRLAVSISTLSKERELHYQAHYDYLTKLPNRRLLSEHLKQEIEVADRYDTKIAVIFADLDNFKQVNDSFGHGLGDQLLLDVSSKLTDYLGEGCTVARQGGDEFILLVPGVTSESVLSNTLTGVINLFKEPSLLSGHYIYSSMSLGVAIYPEHGEDINRLLMSSDMALYHAKASGKSCYRFYEESMHSTVLQRMEIENALRLSIDRQELEFYYQPLFNAQNRSFSFEALLRWKHPEKGFISPAEFIPVAEETGFILKIDQWMFDTIFEQINRWRFDEDIHFDKIAINISPLQLLSPDFLHDFSSTIERHNIPASWLELEITEGVLLENHETAKERLLALKALGVTLSLDDFGTGYSSLSYLQTLPFDRIKIDQSFVREIQSGNELPALIKTIISMAKSLNLYITAEGVEEEYQFEILKELGCDTLQGYHIAKPLPSSECASFVDRFTSENREH